MYSLRDFHIKGRRFYAHELQKVSTYLQPPKTSNKILINDVIFSEDSILRSGKVLAIKKTPLYKITRGDQEETVPASDIKFFKKIWGTDSLIYNKVFEEPEKQRFVI